MKQGKRLGNTDLPSRAHGRADDLLVGMSKKAGDVEEASAVPDGSDSLESRKRDALPRVEQISVKYVEGSRVTPERFEDPVSRDDCLIGQLAARGSGFRLQCLNGITHWNRLLSGYFTLPREVP